VSINATVFPIHPHTQLGHLSKHTSQSSDMSEVVSIIGDSNFNRHLDSAKSANPHLHCLRLSHLIPALNAMQLETALTSQNEHRQVVVVAALTNTITCTAFLGGDQLYQDAKIFFQQVNSWIQQGRSFDDGANRTFLILPPQFRMQPHWYHQYYTCVLAVFKEVFRAPGPQIWILPPFLDPQFEEDGYHYTSISGHLYVQHLVNSAHQIFESTVKPDATAKALSSQLQGVRSEISELRFKQIQTTARQEEEEDRRLNTEAENQFVIAGLSITKADTWQDRQASYVKASKEFLVKLSPALAPVMIKFCRVVSSTPRLFLNVECDSVESSSQVRMEWAKLVKSGAAKKTYPNITIANSVTTGTRVRCAILRVYAKAYLRENPQGSATVNAFTSRPHFVFRAGKTLSQTSLTFCQTIMEDDLPFPAKEDLESAYRIAGAKQFKGRLRDVFRILTDDHYKKLTGDAMTSLSETFCSSQGLQGSINSAIPEASHGQQGQQAQWKFWLCDRRVQVKSV
jgi:hypothetical protein